MQVGVSKLSLAVIAAFLVIAPAMTASPARAQATQDAAVEAPADDADPTATTEGGAAPSREGAELDIF